jgi:phosphate uptake regulator
MKRRLVKQGAATMMISLPTKWIKENNLGKGDEVDVIELEKNLLISKEFKNLKKETELTVTIPIRTAVQVMITNAYRADYHKVKVNYKDPKVYSIIKQIVDEQLLGYEIIQKAEGYCIIENIASLTETQFDNIFSKLLMNIEETFDYAAQYLKGERVDFEKTQDKTKEFDNLCRRIIFREQMAKSELRVDFHSELMHAQREIYLLLLYLSKNKTKSDKTELDLLIDCRKTFEMVREAYYTKSIETLEKLIEFEQSAYKKAYKALEKSDPIIIHHLMNVLRGFYLSTSPLVGILI